MKKLYFSDDRKFISISSNKHVYVELNCIQYKNNRPKNIIEYWSIVGYNLIESIKFDSNETFSIRQGTLKIRKIY